MTDMPKQKYAPLRAPASPRLTVLNIPDMLPETPLFEDMHVQDIAAAEWLPTYSAEPWRFDACKLERCDLAARSIPRLTMWDSIAVRLDISAARLFEATMLRCEFIGCRASGAQCGEAVLKDVVFQQCKLNMLSFRACKLERVVFEGCVLDEADFANAHLKDVVFIDCDLQRTIFDRAQCSNVDFTKSDVSTIQGAMSLKGARIRPEQMVQLAPLLCTELGIQVVD